jgi:ABC-type glycerol-3-phosphate transport system substrate-binding protein
MTKFKIGLSIIFSVFIILGVILFASSKGSNSTPTANITVWGFLSPNSFNNFVKGSTLGQDKTINVTYVQEIPDNFQNDFVNALADGSGPDVIMISQDMLLKNKNKIFVIPYANYSQRTFTDSFVQEGEMFLDSTGVVAVPFMIDPLVTYWNRDIFNNASIPNPPKYWDELLTLPAKLSQQDKAGNLTQNTIALGEWGNVSNAKGILSQIMLSAGSPIVDSTSNSPKSALDYSSGASVSPAVASVNFYTQFSNPNSQTYSWNRGMPQSLSQFLSGNLAIYLGFASEVSNIRAKNPNLNFDVAPILQPRQATKKIVFAKMYGLALVKQSKNLSAGFRAISQMTDDASMQSLESYTNLPPVKRSLLSNLPTDKYKVVFYQSALSSLGWLDPDSSATDKVFQDMVESVTSGRAKTSEAVSTANDSLNNLLK